MSFGVFVFLLVFCYFVFFRPEGWGLLVDRLNFTPANILRTPSDIHPLWFFLPFYALLRGVPNKTYGVAALVGAFALLLILPWLDRNPIKSIRYRSTLYKINIIVMPISFIILGVIASGSATPSNMVIGLHFAEVFYATFLLLPYFNRVRSRGATIAWLVVLEAGIWLTDEWMYATHAHGWALMLRTDWVPTLYVAAILVSALVWPSLTWDARRLPERLTMGGLLH